MSFNLDPILQGTYPDMTEVIEELGLPPHTRMYRWRYSYTNTVFTVEFERMGVRLMAHLNRYDTGGAPNLCIGFAKPLEQLTAHDLYDTDRALLIIKRFESTVQLRVDYAKLVLENLFT